MERAVIVCIDKKPDLEHIKHLLTIDELNEELAKGWKVISQDPFGVDFNLLVLKQKD
jgi:hypothetical protein